MKIHRNMDIELSEEEMYRVTTAYAHKYPEAIKVILDNVTKDKGKFFYCPFPTDCKRFPCGKLNCNADVCSNGHAYRMS